MKYYAILFFIFFSCKSKEENALEKMKSIYEKSLSDEAFKQNMTLTILQLDAISIDTITENAFDSLQSAIYQIKIDDFVKLGNEAMEKSKKKTELARLSYQVSDNLGNQFKEIALESMKDIKGYIDSSSYYLKLDSILSNKIKNRVNPNVVYKAKFFLKASMGEGTQSQNILDTVFCFFNNDIKQIKISI